MKHFENEKIYHFPSKSNHIFQMALPLNVLESLAESKSIYAIVLNNAKTRKALHEFLETIPGVSHKSIFCRGVSEENSIPLIESRL